MDVAKLNKEISGVDLEYKNVYIDAENTRMIRAKLPDSSSGSLWLGYSDYPFNRPERISLSPEWI